MTVTNSTRVKPAWARGLLWREWRGRVESFMDSSGLKFRTGVKVLLGFNCQALTNEPSAFFSACLAGD
jgi:hypothetical protein